MAYARLPGTQGIGTESEFLGNETLIRARAWPPSPLQLAAWTAGLPDSRDGQTCTISARQSGTLTARIPQAADASRPEQVDSVIDRLPREFALDGGLFRVIRADRWEDGSEHYGYQIVPVAEAARIFQRIGTRAGLSQAQRVAFVEATSLITLSEDSSAESRLLLLRSRPTPAAVAKSPAASPPQPPRRRVAEVHWIEVAVVDEAGVPVRNLACSVITPDQVKHDCVTDADGIVRFDNIPAGDCKVSLLRPFLSA